MPVVPYSTNLFQDCKQLFEFLSDCQQKSIDKTHVPIASIAIETNGVDPLAVLHEILEPNELHFYLENTAQGEAIAAIGTALDLKIEGKQRFSQTKTFVQSCFKRLIPFHSISASLPRFFCSFSFFDQPFETAPAFPSATVFLPRWQISTQHNHSTVITNLPIYPASDLTKIVDNIREQFQKIQLSKYSVFNLQPPIRPDLNQWDLSDTNGFKSAVISALESIQVQHLDKLVLAHAFDVVAQIPFQWIHSLNNLRRLHPDCYVFSTGNGQGQSFIGASPERLISIRDRLLVTDALAGSAPRGQTIVSDADLAHRLLNSSKERHEHQVVVDFILEQLGQFELAPQLSTSPKLLQLPNIQHLHTPVQAVLPDHLHPLEILAKLHPTPAVAGVPRDIACQEIRRYEPFERSLYAAPLGWVDIQGNAEFIVGIRSAMLEGHRARLYAGAGIVAGSDPDRELAEIRLKLQAMLQTLV